MDNHSESSLANEIEDHPDLAVLKPGETLTPIRLPSRSKVPTTISMTELPIPARYPSADNATKREAFRKVEHTRRTYPLVDDENDPLGAERLKLIADRIRQPTSFGPVSGSYNGAASPPLPEPEPTTGDYLVIGGLLLLGIGAGFLIYYMLTKTVDGTAVSSTQQGLLPKQP